MVGWLLYSTDILGSSLVGESAPRDAGRALRSEGCSSHPPLLAAAGRTAADVSEEGGQSHMAEAYVKAAQEIEREAA